MLHLKFLNVAALCVVFWGMPASAEDWGKKDTALEISWQVLHVADYLQTKQAMSESRWEEKNPLLGRRPSQDVLNTAFLLSSVGHYWVSTRLRPKTRTAYQWITIGIKALVVTHNHSIGVRVSF